jgi:Protein of unknown function (DUF4239)
MRGTVHGFLPRALGARSLMCGGDRPGWTTLEGQGAVQMMMQPGMVYDYPLWGVGLLLAGGAALGGVFLGLAAWLFLSLEFRRRHNDVAAAIFSVIGTTFAVLLAFVAQLAWQHFNDAKAASYAEAGSILDVYNVSVGFAEPERSSMRDDIIGYVETVVRVEWPAQARGQTVEPGSAFLRKLNAMAIVLKPSDVAGGNLQVALLQSLTRLWDARQQRLLAADTTIPAVVWIVTIVGGFLTVAFASLLGVPSLGLHLAMSAALAVSGALVLILIIALSNPFRGDFRVSTDPFDRVLAQIEAATSQP